MANFAARFERKNVLIIALTGLAGINFIASAMPTFESLLIVRIVGGVVASLITPVAAASASSLAHDSHRGKALAVVLGGLTLSLVLGIPIGSLVGSIFTWRTTFVFSGTLIAVAAVFVSVLLPHVPHTDQRGIRSLGIFKQRNVYGNLMLTMVAFLATFSFIAYLSPVAKQVAGIEGSKVSLLQIAVGIGSIMGVIAGGRLADHKHTSRIIRTGFTFISITLLCSSLLMLKFIAFSNLGNAVFLGIILWAGSIGQFTLSPIIQGRLVGAAPNNRNVVLALNGSMIFLGQGGGAALGGLIISTAGLSYLGIFGCILAIVGFLVSFISKKQKVQSLIKENTLKVI
jgi:DHA1 family inner membrane transport protein